MTPLPFLSPRTAVRASGIQGRGLFAAEPIAQDEIVAVKGGHIVGRREIEQLRRRLGPMEIQVAEDLFIAPVNEVEREGSMIFSNHSCEPNIGVRGGIVFVAMRDIAAGEELTHDWAMTDDDSDSMACRCGTASCRGEVTGKDWMLPDLQARYAGYFSAYLAEKIRRLRGRATL